MNLSLLTMLRFRAEIASSSVPSCRLMLRRIFSLSVLFGQKGSKQTRTDQVIDKRQ